MKTGEDFDVVSAARAAWREGDGARIAELLSRHPLEMWFGLPTPELQVVIESASEALLEQGGVGAIALQLVSGTRMGIAPDAVEDVIPADMRLFIDAMMARLTGDPVTSAELLRQVTLVSDPAPAVFDPTRGMRAFAVVQAGISAMLAGHLVEALAYFDKALACPVPPSLAFLHRDAHLRAAIIHALYGDPAVARRRHAAAAVFPRTESWVEHVLDADEVLVSSLLRPTSEAAGALEDLLRVPVAATQELWAFHLAGAYKLSVVTGRPDLMRARLGEFESAHLVGAEGTGFVGSALAFIRAFDAVTARDPGRAEALLATADGSLWQVQLLSAVCAIVRGRSASAERSLRESAAQTRPLRQAEGMRLVCLALARSSAGDEDAAIVILGEAAPFLDSYALAMLQAASPELMTVAAERIPEWPVAEQPVPPEPAAGILDVEAFTDRELEVLRGLVRGQSRAEIAESLFLTVNTIKSHHRSLYRKLGVNSKSDAVREAYRRALV